MGTGVRFACITHGGPRPRGAGPEPIKTPSVGRSVPNCELFAGRSGYREPVGDSRYTRGEPPTYQGWRLVRCKGKTGQTRHPRLRHPTLSPSPHYLHYLRRAPVEANGTRLRDWNHSVAAIGDFPFPADRTSTLWHPGDQCSVRSQWLPVRFRKGRATDCREDATPSYPGHRCSGCMPLCGRAPCW